MTTTVLPRKAQSQKEKKKEVAFPLILRASTYHFTEFVYLVSKSKTGTLTT